MKSKLYLSLALFCGAAVTFLVVTNRPAGATRSAPSPETSQLAASARIEAPSETVETATPPESGIIASPSKLFLTTELFWREPVPEEAFARFKDWTERYLAAEPASRAGLLAEGVELATSRRAALKELIQSNPERALELTVPSGVRKQLPVEIASLLENQINARGKL